MAEITVALIKELREKTSAGMMDCKQALQATHGDVQDAIDWLRKKGIAKAGKKADRIAAEGLIGLALGQTAGALIEVNSETDFVARNTFFQDAVAEISTLGLSVSDVEALQAAQCGSGESVRDFLATLVAKIGENIFLRRLDKLAVSEGVVAGYIHNAVRTGMGKIGVLVALESSIDRTALMDLGHKISMHVAAANPLALDVANLDADVVARERQVLIEEARESGKPEAIIEKMVDGRMQKFFKESVLLTQMYVIDNERSIAEVISDTAKALGSDIRLTGFVRMALGEGIEKKAEDFAAEVAKSVASS